MRFSVLFLILTVCYLADAQPVIKRVLFLGNSLTYVNDLPTQLKKLSHSLGDSVYSQQSTPDGYLLENHYTNTTSLNFLRNGGPWDYVVLQEQSQVPTIPSYRYYSMYPYGYALDTIARNRCFKSLIFITPGWKNGGQQCDPGGNYCSYPLPTYYHYQDTIIMAYEGLAKNLKAEISPVGAATRYIREFHPKINTWESDGVHPSLRGQYLAACVFYSVLFRKSPVGATYTANLPQAEVATMQQVAWNVVSGNWARWRIDTLSPLRNIVVKPIGTPQTGWAVVNRDPNADTVRIKINGMTYVGDSVVLPMAAAQGSVNVRVTRVRRCEVASYDTTVNFSITKAKLGESDEKQVLWANTMGFSVSSALVGSNYVLYNTAGQTILQGRVSADGQNQWPKALQSGMYVLVVRGRCGGVSQKFVVW